jgi:hypothetical protein
MKEPIEVPGNIKKMVECMPMEWQIAIAKLIAGEIDMFTGWIAGPDGEKKLCICFLTKQMHEWFKLMQWASTESN